MSERLSEKDQRPPQAQRHHCAECNRFVAEAEVETYWSIEEGCQTATAYCAPCGGRTEAYLDRWPVNLPPTEQATP